MTLAKLLERSLDLPHVSSYTALRRIVSHHKAIPTWLAVVLTAASAALMAWAATHSFANDVAEKLREYALVLGFGVAIGLPIQWTMAGRWFELTDDALRSYRRERLLRVARLTAKRSAS